MAKRNRKRGQGEGSFQQLASGNWQVQCMDGYKDDGKRNIVSFTAPTRAEAADKLRSYQQQKTLPSIPEEHEAIGFSAFADDWYARYRTQVEASTYCSYYYTLALLKNFFKDNAIDQIKTSHINNFINSLQEQKYSTSAVRKCRAMLIQIFDEAEADDLIVKNYARRAFTGRQKRSLEQAESSGKDAFTLDEFHLLMEQLPENRIGYSIRLMLISGLRLQELIALTPGDIAEDGSSVSVTKAVKIVNGYPIMGVTKSRSSERVVPIPKQYRYITLWLRNNCGQIYLWCSAKRTNLLYDTASVRRAYYRAVEKIPGVRRLSPHCCRHTYVTLLQRQGIPLETISKLTGHCDIETTGIYLHIAEDTLEQAVSTLEALA